MASIMRSRCTLATIDAAAIEMHRPIATHDTARPDIKLGQPVSINKYRFGLHMKALDSLFHGPERRVENVIPVYSGNITNSDGGWMTLSDLLGKLFAQLRFHAF